MKLAELVGIRMDFLNVFSKGAAVAVRRMLPPNRSDLAAFFFEGGIPKFQGGFHMGKLKKNTGIRYLKI